MILSTVGAGLILDDVWGRLQKVELLMPELGRPYLPLVYGGLFVVAYLLQKSEHKREIEALKTETDVALTVEQVFKFGDGRIGNGIVVTLRVNNLGDPTSLRDWTATLEAGNALAHLDPVMLYQRNLGFEAVYYTPKDDVMQAFVHTPIPKNAITYGVLVLELNDISAPLYIKDAVLTVTCKDVLDKTHAAKYSVVSSSGAGTRHFPLRG